MTNTSNSYDISTLGDDERRVLTFVRAYVQTRKEHGQWGYEAWRGDPKDFLKTPVFKQFRTVVRWLDSLGWQISWREVHWQGFLRYVFTEFDPSIPQPGQLRNKMLLARYIKSSPTEAGKPRRTAKELEEVYQRVVRPEISRSATMMTILGLKRIK